MALSINTREGTDMSNKVTVDRRLWLDDDGNLVEDGDPDAAFLWAIAGREVLESEAEELGYQPKDADEQPDADVNADYDTSHNEDDGSDVAESDEDSPDRNEPGDDTAPDDTDAEDGPEHVCDECGFEAKNAAGLGSHQRKHED